MWTVVALAVCTPFPSSAHTSTQFSPNKITMAAANLPPGEGHTQPLPSVAAPWGASHMLLLLFAFLSRPFFDVNLISAFTFWGFPLVHCFLWLTPHPCHAPNLSLASCLSQCPLRLCDHIRNASFNVDIAAAHQPRWQRHLCLVSPVPSPLPFSSLPSSINLSHMHFDSLEHCDTLTSCPVAFKVSTHRCSCELKNLCCDCREICHSCCCCWW